MNMQVAKNTVVTLDYSVTDTDGELVDAGQEPLVYLHGGYDDIFSDDRRSHAREADWRVGGGQNAARRRLR